MGRVLEVSNTLLSCKCSRNNTTSVQAEAFRCLGLRAMTESIGLWALGDKGLVVGRGIRGENCESVAWLSAVTRRDALLLFTEAPQSTRVDGHESQQLHKFYLKYVASNK
jgi:hypothetical protein